MDVQERLKLTKEYIALCWKLKNKKSYSDTELEEIKKERHDLGVRLGIERKRHDEMTLEELRHDKTYLTLSRNGIDSLNIKQPTESDTPKASNAEELTNLLIKAVENKQDIPNAFRRNDIGPIDIDYGNKKMGLEHILLRRKSDGTLSILSEQEIMQRIAIALERGYKEPEARYGTTIQIRITYGNTSVALVKNPAVMKEGKSRKNAWIITSWFISKEELERLKNFPESQRREEYLKGEEALSTK